MGLLSRFRAIFQAKANQVVDQMENPKASLDYSLVKLEESRRQIGRSLVEVSAAKTRLEKFGRPDLPATVAEVPLGHLPASSVVPSLCC